MAEIGARDEAGSDASDSEDTSDSTAETAKSETNPPSGYRRAVEKTPEIDRSESKERGSETANDGSGSTDGGNNSNSGSAEHSRVAEKKRKVAEDTPEPDQDSTADRRERVGRQTPDPRSRTTGSQSGSSTDTEPPQQDQPELDPSDAVDANDYSGTTQSTRTDLSIAPDAPDPSGELGELDPNDDIEQEDLGDTPINNPVTGNRVEEDLDRGAKRTDEAIESGADFAIPDFVPGSETVEQGATGAVSVLNPFARTSEAKEIAETAGYVAGTGDAESVVAQGAVIGRQAGQQAEENPARFVGSLAGGAVIGTAGVRGGTRAARRTGAADAARRGARRTADVGRRGRSKASSARSDLSQEIGRSIRDFRTPEGRRLTDRQRQQAGGQRATGEQSQARPGTLDESVEAPSQGARDPSLPQERYNPLESADIDARRGRRQTTGTSADASQPSYLRSFGADESAQASLVGRQQSKQTSSSGRSSRQQSAQSGDKGQTAPQSGRDEILEGGPRDRASDELQSTLLEQRRQGPGMSELDPETGQTGGFSRQPTSSPSVAVDTSTLDINLDIGGAAAGGAVGLTGGVQEDTPVNEEVGRLKTAQEFGLFGEPLLPDREVEDTSIDLDDETDTTVDTEAASSPEVTLGGLGLDAGGPSDRVNDDEGVDIGTIPTVESGTDTGVGAGTETNTGVVPGLGERTTPVSDTPEEAPPGGGSPGGPVGPGEGTPGSPTGTGRKPSPRPRPFFTPQFPSGSGGPPNRQPRFFTDPEEFQNPVFTGPDLLAAPADDDDEGEEEEDLFNFGGLFRGGL